MLLKDDKSARSLWKLAKIKELIPSSDNEITAAKVRVVNSDEGQSGLLRRPLQQLISLKKIRCLRRRRLQLKNYHN